MQAVVTRRFNSGGRNYRKGEKITLSEIQFSDWQSVGLVEAAAKPKAKDDE